jgi:hypothetical protein
MLDDHSVPVVQMDDSLPAADDSQADLAAADCRVGSAPDGCSESADSPAEADSQEHCSCLGVRSLPVDFQDDYQPEEVAPASRAEL